MRTRRTSLRFLGSVSLIALASSGTAHAGFQELGMIPGGDAFGSRALGVSGDGNVVVGSASRIYQGEWVTIIEEQAFRSVNGVMTGIESIVPAHDRSIARNANYDGSVVTGNVYRWPGNDQGGFLWENGTFSLLGDFPGGSTWSVGYDVSDDGTMIAGHSVDAVSDHAMEWNAGVLTNLFMGSQWNYARAISGDGSKIAGFDQNAGAVRWDWGVPTALTPPAGSFSTRAYGISSDGGTVVGYSLMISGEEATRWDEGVPTTLGLLPGDAATRADDASADGSVVVGYSRAPSGARTATIWLPWVGIQDLYDVLDEAGDPVSGWVLREATGVSDDGLTVVGYGTHPSGYERGFVATLPAPEPSFGIGLAMASLTFARLVRRPGGKGLLRDRA